MEKFCLNLALEESISHYMLWNLWGIGVSISMIFYVVTKYIFNTFATI